MSKKMELLNSEGCILKAELSNGIYKITDQWKKEVAFLDVNEIQEFIHGDSVISDSKNRKFKYSEYPGSMKPDLKELDEFIGIDTTGKTY